MPIGNQAKYAVSALTLAEPASPGAALPLCSCPMAPSQVLSSLFASPGSPFLLPKTHSGKRKGH